ncbi:DUF5455 family protein [Massilia sp. SYSU DXS3249]
MPLLASFMSTLFGAVFAFLGRFMVAEKAARLAAWSVSFAAIAGLVSLAFSCISGICADNIQSGISGSHPGFSMGLGIAWNGVTATAASCYMTVWVACQLYVIKKKAINVIIGG